METGNDAKSSKIKLDPNDLTGVKLNGKPLEEYDDLVEDVNKNVDDLSNKEINIKVPKKEISEINKLYEGWARGEIDYSQIQKYEEEQKKIQDNNNDTSGENVWSRLGNKIQQIIPIIKNFKENLNNIGSSSKELELLKYKISEIEEKLQKAKNGEIHLSFKEVLTAEAELEKLNAKKQKLEGENKGNFFSNIFSNLKKVIPSMNNLSGMTNKVKNTIKQWGGGMKQGLGHILKYAGALFSLRGIYSTLSGCAQSWLSSQNKGAQQLSANIEYMKYAMGSAFAPVIQYVTNLVYQLLKAIQSLVYAFSGVNIFAKATASSMKSASGSASKTSKSLAGVHSEINNVSENNSGSSGNTTPNIDMTSIGSNITDFMQRVKNKMMQLFQPIKESWDVYGKPLIESAKNAFDGVKSLVESIGQSLQEVWLNGTGTETINLLLQGWTSIFNIIGNIGQAFSIAWQNGNVGTSVVQSLWNSFNNLYSILIGAYQTFEKWTASKSFQTFADSIMGICKTLSGWFEQITIKLKEIWENGGKETFTKLLEFISKLTEAVDAVLKFLDPVIQWVLDVVTPVIQGIIEVIGYVIDALSGVLDFIIGVFTGDWNRAWQGIKDFFSGIWNAIKTVVSTVFNAIKTVITTILNSIKTVWNNIWNGIKTTVVNIWNGIWSGIKSVINKILGGIESFVNGIIKGINKLLSGISNAASAVGSIFGIKPVSLQLSTMSLPRLAKGNVAYSETVAVFGEYSGARNNPEITAPQNVLRETFSDVLAEHEYGKSQDTGMFKQLIIQFGSMQVAVEIDKLIQQARRQNGTAKITV